ncbi:retinol dehydrogenase 16-like [Crotalus adamanteus]|uniref:Retinol dehydrogenase 16-like n=1 Tax=Crotalus adamanteus TaxID=8729 RepID=A0AAW1BZS5_CROAD
MIVISQALAGGSAKGTFESHRSCLTQQAAEKLKEATSERLQTTLIDVTSTESLDKATEWVKSQVGDKGLWGLVNNAGISVPTAPNEWLTKEDFKKIIDINLLGVIDVTIHMIPLLRKAKGRIVNIASVMGRLSTFGGGYCPSKYGVESFSDSLRIELFPFGVKVCIIEPGYFKTAVTNDKILHENFRSIWERLPKETKEVYGESYFNAMIQGTTKMQDKCSAKLYLVTNCMEHALTAVHPRFRYSAVNGNVALFRLLLASPSRSLSGCSAPCMVHRRRPAPAPPPPPPPPSPVPSGLAPPAPGGGALSTEAV